MQACMKPGRGHGELGALPGSLYPTEILHAEPQTFHGTHLPWRSDCSCPAWGLPG